MIPAEELTTPATVGNDPTLVIRPRLLERLPPVPATRVTVLRAPAGYGKTVLASRWASIRAALPVAWVGLRRGDDGRRIAARLLDGAEALGVHVTPETRIAQPTHGPAIGNRFLAMLGRQLGGVEAAVLVLDALDAPAQPALVAELERWITTLPPTVRTVITRRQRPGPGFALPSEELTEIETAELAFTPEETLAVVRQIAGVGLGDEQLGSLVRRTEGWPFAVRVAAIGMRGNADVDTVIRRVHGGNGHIAAMLSTEVLEQQPEPVRRFLLRTSVLDTLHPSLCASLAVQPGSDAVLRTLERTGAFTEADPDHDGAYRYLPLFRDYLRTRLRAEEPEAEHTLLAQAAEWFARHGQGEEAARYAIESDDPLRLIELVDRFAGQQFELGEPASMLTILDALPDRRDLALRRAAVLTMLGETRRAEQVLRAAEGVAEDSGTAQEPGTEAVSRVLRALWVFFDATPETAITAANRALELLRTTDPASVPNILGLSSADQLEVMALGSRARARWLSGELEQSRDELRSILERPNLYPPWHVHALSAGAMLEAWAGNLRAALSLGREAVLLAARHRLLQHPATLDAYLAIAHGLLERNDLARSEHILGSAEERLRHFRQPTTFAMFTAELATWCLAAGQPERGLAAVRALRTSGEAPPPKVVAEHLLAAEARLLLERGDLTHAEAVTRAVEAPVDADFAASTVQVAVARGDLPAARERLARWENRPTDLKSGLERGLWTAIVDVESGDRLSAARRLRGTVLPSAVVEGHRRVFLDAGEHGQRALRVLSRAEPSRFVEELLRTAESSSRVNGGAAGGLSERELEILRYLPTDLSSAEIADRLYISVNTLKTHLRTIYRKLDVGGRREAIERAAALGVG